jgi:hypothetical protein
MATPSKARSVTWARRKEVEISFKVAAECWERDQSSDKDARKVGARLDA